MAGIRADGELWRTQSGAVTILEACRLRFHRKSPCDFHARQVR